MVSLIDAQGAALLYTMGMMAAPCWTSHHDNNHKQSIAGWKHDGFDRFYAQRQLSQG